MARIYRKPRMWRAPYVGATVVGDAPVFIEPKKRRNKAQENARKRKAMPTPAERELEIILNTLDGGALRGRFFREWAFADKWILDFFFSEVRLGIEVDGSIHTLPTQREIDRKKEKSCKRWDITLIRITNREVFRNRGDLLEKLREGWRTAEHCFKRSVYARLEP